MMRRSLRVGGLGSLLLVATALWFSASNTPSIWLVDCQEVCRGGDVCDPSAHDDRKEYENLGAQTIQQNQGQRERERKRERERERKRQGCPARLVPSDLSPIQFFDAFDSTIDETLSVLDNFTVAKGDAVRLEQTVKHGSVLQQGRTGDSSELAVLPGLVPRPVVAEMLTLLRGHEDPDVANGGTTFGLDADPDSVDGMPTREFYLYRHGGLPSKKVPGVEYEAPKDRDPILEKLRDLTDPYSMGLLPQILRLLYGKETCGSEGRTCTLCHSLIRRYKPGDRQSHAPHNDGHAFVTVVVSLSDYGGEYKGGLYVATSGSRKKFLRLDRGDAVVHQADLLHGVTVQDRRDDGKPSERWSWILWYKDSDTCEDHSGEWFHDCAENGNPTCLYQKGRMVQIEEAIALTQKASDAGHSLAKIKLAYAYLGATRAPSIEPDVVRAEALFAEAVRLTNEPDGHYGLACLYLAKARGEVMGPEDATSKSAASWKILTSPTSSLHRAAHHLEEAAKGEHPLAMFNLGICHNFGYCKHDIDDHPTDNNLGLAADWYVASGLPEGYAAKAMLLITQNKNEEAQWFKETATKLGYGEPWRRSMRDSRGHMGIPGPSLNLLWPPLPNGAIPPQW